MIVDLKDESASAFINALLKCKKKVILEVVEEDLLRITVDGVYDGHNIRLIDFVVEANVRI